MSLASPNRDAIFIGINGGHHNSTGWAFDLSSNEYHITRDNGINFHNTVPLNVSRLRLNRLLKSLAEQLRISIPELQKRSQNLVIALPGAICFKEDSTDKSHFALQELLEPFKTWQVVDDTWAGLYAHTGSAFGVCGYASAGASVCYAGGAFSSDKRFKIDGWGPIIGDHGSAFDIVADYFRALGRKVDLDIDCEVFESLKLFVNHLSVVLYDEETERTLPKLDSPADSQEWFDELVSFGRDEQWRSFFSQIATPILNFADNRGSSDVHTIVIENAKRFAQSILICIAKAKGSRGIPIVLQGGMIRNSRLYRTTVQEQLLKEGYQSIESIAKSALGALMMAIDGIEKTDGEWSFVSHPATTSGLAIRDLILGSRSS